MKQKFILGILIGLVAGIGIGRVFFNTPEQKTLQNFSDLEGVSQGKLDGRIPQTEQVSEDVNRYTNEHYGFSFEYPTELSIKEYDEGNNSQTTVFQRGDEQYGFQVFVTPYSKKEITKERILKDIPSGMVENPLEVVIGEEQRALAFLSRNTFMGDTREVWFIRGGFLYEITTYKSQDEWLASILKSLKFNE